MHKMDFDVNIEKLAKIEGHASLNIKVREGEVEDIDLRVVESNRFFAEAVKGKHYNTVPQLVSRICGTCSIAHLTACIEAVEKTLKIKPSEQTMLLRKLTVYSMMIRDHALHLYFFVLPDIFKLDSLLDLADKRKDLVHNALHVKEAGNKLSKLVAGRAVHAVYEQVGGFSRIPEKDKIAEVIEELYSIRKFVIELAEIFYKCDWELNRDTNFISLVTPDFSFLEGTIKSTSGTEVLEENFWDHLHKVVIPFSTASGFKYEDKEYMVGALARLNLNKENLHKDTKTDMEKYLKLFPSTNIYHNNLAQAVEILHSIDHSIEILENNDFQEEEPVKADVFSGEGVGVIEAPRGTLYYWLAIDDSKIRYINLVIPTAQNLINMKKDIRQMVERNIENGEEVIRKKAEKIIRAYDPCMSCATHFLKVKFI